MADDGLTAAANDSQTVLGDSQPAVESAPQSDVSSQGQTGSVEQPTQGNAQDVPKWTEQLPREFRDKFTGYGSYKEFVSAADEALGLKERAIVKPADDAPSEEWDRFYASVGRPDGPDGYEIPDDAGDPQLVSGFKQKAHELGLTTQQAKNLFGWYTEAEKAMDTQRREQLQAGAEKVRETLKEEWGSEYDTMLKNIERFKLKYGSAEVAQELNNPAIGNNPNLIKLLARAGADLASDNFVEGQPSQQKPQKSNHLSYEWMRDKYPTKSE